MPEGNALGRAPALRRKLEKACALLARPLEARQSQIGHLTHPQCVAFALQDPNCHLAYLVNLTKILQETIDVMSNDLPWGNNPRNFFTIE